MLFAPSLAMDPTDPEAYDYNVTRPASHPSLVNALDRVKSIFQDACRCTEFGRDENACIQPSYLSIVSEPTPASPNRRVALTRKTDFCFSYSCFDPQFAELYTQFAAKTPVVSHTSDGCTQRLALFSEIEVKPENDDLKEAGLQISIWMAASLRKQIEPARLAFPTSDLLRGCVSRSRPTVSAFVVSFCRFDLF
ncbi:unnamed protein product [Alternaria alternata]